MQHINPNGKSGIADYSQEVEPILRHEFDEYHESEAIFFIVLRNLAYLHWRNLLPEAQLQMIEEAATLLASERLSIEKKLQLGERLSALEVEVAVGKQRIREILILLEELNLIQQTCA